MEEEVPFSPLEAPAVPTVDAEVPPAAALPPLPTVAAELSDEIDDPPVATPLALCAHAHPGKVARRATARPMRSFDMLNSYLRRSALRSWWT
jgi:hypothetical protein